jgi:hypothetical protein
MTIKHTAAITAAIRSVTTADPRTVGTGDKFEYSTGRARGFAGEFPSGIVFEPVEMASRAIEARLTYVGPMTVRARYYAFNSARNVITRDCRTVRIEDARSRYRPPSLAGEGFALVPHESAVADFHNPQELARIYEREMERLVTEVSGADKGVVCGPIILRFREAAGDSGRLHILRPGHVVHTDMSDSIVAGFTERWRPRQGGRTVQRFAHYNLWRALSPPPQDIPLALCDARSVSPADLVDADSILDIPGKPESSTVAVVVRHNTEHRWSYFPNLMRHEVLVFKSHDSDPHQPRQVPHSAFRDRSCPTGVATRISIEARVVAFWFAS